MTRQKKQFLTSQQIEEEWRIWKDTGQMTEQLGRYALLLSRKLLSKPQFKGYPQHMKDDMVSDAAIKILKNLHNLDPQKGSLFAYWTQIAWSAFIDYLSKHYKNVNQHRQLLLDELERVRQETCNGRLNEEAIRVLEKMVEKYDTTANAKYREEDDEQWM